MEKYKVTTTEGITANAGEVKQGTKAPQGLAIVTAESDAAERNERAAAMGIKARYKVEPLEPR